MKWPARQLRCLTCTWPLLLFVSALQISEAVAAETKPPVERLLDRTPFDQVVLNQAAGGTTLEVLPLSIPQQPDGATPKTGSLKVRLLSRPTEEFEVAWSNVAAVRNFEQVLLNEAQRLTAAGKFDEAYDYFARLSAVSPALPNLNEAICNYLQKNALSLYQAKQPDRAMSLLITLYERNPTYPGLASAVETISGEKIQQYLRDGNYAAARRVLDLWQKQFQDIATQTALAWQQRFEVAASRQLADANQRLAKRDFIVRENPSGALLRFGRTYRLRSK